jgi:glycosyltransferase involved in cell wall biosynthesis
MDLDGYFSRVFLAFFRADADNCYPVSSRHTVLDIAGTHAGARQHPIRAEIGFLGQAIRLIRRNHIAAVQANDPYLSGFHAFILSRLTRIPFAIELVSDYDLSFEVAGKRTMPYLPSRTVEKRMERFVLRHADAVYADRQYYLKYALNNGARSERAGLVRCITDPFYYEATPRSRKCDGALTSGCPALLYVGRLSPEKYPFDLLECLRLVRDGGEDAVLLVAGDGELRDEFGRRAEALEVADKVKLLGNRTAQELVDLMHAASVILATHAGYALLEEALSGTPIVAYDYEWHPEVIRHEETGLLVPYRDTSAMAEQALRLLRDRAFGYRLGASARRFALENHSPAGAIQDERRLYEMILGSRGRPAGTRPGNLPRQKEPAWPH